MPNYENQQKEKKMKQKHPCHSSHFIFAYVRHSSDRLRQQRGRAGGGETQSDVQAEEQTEPSAAEFLKEDGTADIQALQAINAEVYAWLEITGTDISFPIRSLRTSAYLVITYMGMRMRIAAFIRNITTIRILEIPIP